jgi:hypothetical protein
VEAENKQKKQRQKTIVPKTKLIFTIMIDIRENKEKFIDAACWVAVLSAAAYFVIRIIVELF